MTGDIHVLHTNQKKCQIYILLTVVITVNALVSICCDTLSLDTPSCQSPLKKCQYNLIILRTHFDHGVIWNICCGLLMYSLNQVQQENNQPMLHYVGSRRNCEAFAFLPAWISDEESNVVSCLWLFFTIYCPFEHERDHLKKWNGMWCAPRKLLGVSTPLKAKCLGWNWSNFTWTLHSAGAPPPPPLYHLKVAIVIFMN